MAFTVSGGYYKADIAVGGEFLPYVVFANSPAEALGRLRAETGCLICSGEIEGPCPRNGSAITVSRAKPRARRLSQPRHSSKR